MTNFWLILKKENFQRDSSGKYQANISIPVKKYFGIGIENLSGGYEIRNPIAKPKSEKHLSNQRKMKMKS